MNLRSTVLMMVGAQRTMKENEPRGQLSLSLLQGNNDDMTVSFKKLIRIKIIPYFKRKKTLGEAKTHRNLTQLQWL